ncbi:Alcohol dehydrogenase class-P [Morella rubra]|uniref:alcohol dehydrogenase n=1 Tax=Morella rubra TaxID=262757 RepID=A0A6A1WB50_9ROSI|nr:Alcohol dehydrogenase class-P [Morella rubra]
MTYTERLSCRSPLVGEASAVARAAKFAMSNHWFSTSFESDCLALCNDVLEQVSPPCWVTEEEVAGLRSFFYRHSDCSLAWIPRDQNRLAHSLASWTVDSCSFGFWDTVDIPSKFLSLASYSLKAQEALVFEFRSSLSSSSEVDMSSTAGQVIKCKAAVAWEAGKPLVIEEIEVAPPQANEVRVRILYTSLATLMFTFGNPRFKSSFTLQGQTPMFPRIYGHEAGGIVESVGEGVTCLQEGDHVLPIFTGECGECSHCKSEESNMCELLRINTDRGVMLSDGKSRFSKDGQPIYHFLGTSTFSEYTVIHFGCLAKINPAAPLDKVCVISCGLSTGLGATLNVAKPKKGQSVAVFGLGAVGLAAAEGARISGASRIIGVDMNASRFEQAKKFGCTEFVNPKDHDKPVQEVIAEMTDGGVDRALECTGSVQAMISAFECVHDGWGVAVLVGVPNKDDEFRTHPFKVLSERTLKGTFFGNYKPRTDIPGVVEQYMNKELEVEKFITHSVPFSEINKAFDLMLEGKSLRCIICLDA